MKKIRILLTTFTVLLTDITLAGSFFRNIFSLLFLRVRSPLRRTQLKIIALTGHLGDIVASEPVSRHLRNKFPDAYICWVTDKKYRKIIDSNPFLDRAITVSCLTEWILIRRILKKDSMYDMHINNSVCERHFFVIVKDNPYEITLENYYKKGNLLFAFSRSAGIEMPVDSSPQLYLKKTSPLNGKYIVMHTSSNQAIRMWNPECWNKLAQFILGNLTKHFIVEIGFEKIILQRDQHFIDMTGNKDLSLVAGIIQNSSFFIGIDSGFAHFANALGKDALVLIGSFAGFDEYMPYSGKFQYEKENIIVYHSGPLHSMPCDRVINLVSKKINP